METNSKRTIMIKFLLLFFSIFSLLLNCSCEDDPLLAPQEEKEESGSYGPTSLPGQEEDTKTKNPTIF